MLTSSKIKIKPPVSKAIPFTGGLNTQISNLEIPAGELIQCKNYQEREGKYSGYQSIKGYERFDGQTAPSSVELDGYSDYSTGSDYDLYNRVEDNGYVFYCIQESGSGSNAPDSSTPGDNTWWKYEGAVEDVDVQTDLTREAARTAIAVPTGGGFIRGIHIYNDKVYCWRNASGGSSMDVWESSSSGWSSLSGTSHTEEDGTIRAVNGRFSYYNSNEETMFWVDGVTAQVHTYNGSTVDIINSGDGIPAGEYPIDIGVFLNRLFLVYPGGHILFSEVGNPEGWDTSIGFAGEIYLGRDITGLVVAKGVLVIFTRDSIHLLSYGSTSNEFIFKLDEFSDNLGALSGSVVALLGNVYFADDRGIAKIGPAPNFDGFISNLIGQKIETLYRANRATLSGAAADRDSNRYYIFYTYGGATNGLICTFDDFRLKGITAMELNVQMYCVANGTFSDGSSKIFFGGTDGYVYQLNSGTSFDGDEIETKLQTSYFAYGSPRNWKWFDRLSFEIDCPANTEFTIGKSFDYGSSDLSKPGSHDVEVSGGAVVWGSGIIWGSFIWSGGKLGKCIDYIQGYGTNMSITITTSSKYRGQHTIYNTIVDYQVQAIRQ